MGEEAINEVANPVPDGRLSEARLRRYATVDLAGIRVRRAQTEADFALVASESQDNVVLAL